MDSLFNEENKNAVYDSAPWRTTGLRTKRVLKRPVLWVLFMVHP